MNWTRLSAANAKSTALGTPLRRQGCDALRQPEEIWSHTYADAVQTRDKGWYVTVPLWTTDESPSDLSAEVLVQSDGIARLHAVHVL